MANSKKSAAARGLAKYAADAHRRSAAAYRCRNAEALREKARTRMAMYRQRLKEHEGEWENQKERARASDRKYRERHADSIAQKQRYRRQEAFIEKYGRQAYEERQVREQEVRAQKAAAIAQEVAEEQARIAAQQARRACLVDYAEGFVASKKKLLEAEAAHNRSLALNHMS